MALLLDAVEFYGDQARLHMAIGEAWLAEDKAEAAVASYLQACALEPASPQARNVLGIAYTRLGRYDLALEEFMRASQFNPTFAEAYSNMGVCCQRLGKNEEAIANYRKALEIKPGYGAALYNLGNCLLRMGRPSDAVAWYQQALAVEPRNDKIHTSLGWALREAGQVALSVAAYRDAIRLQPDSALAHFNLSLSLLQLDDYVQGFKEYEWRWRLDPKADPAPPKRPSLDWPEWKGEPLEGKSLLVYAEQGIGDTVQFARFLPMVAAKGARVVLLLPKKLHFILRDVPGIELRDEESRGSNYDYQIALMSLPHLLGTVADKLPAPITIRPDADRVKRWRAQFGGEKFKIGLCWQGKPSASIDRGRSLPLQALAPLGSLKNVQLVSLQKEHGLQQVAGLGPGFPLFMPGPGFDDGPDAFADTVAILSLMDLVVTSDTSIAHVAASMGRPVWLIVKKVPDWRWHIEGHHSAWYPTAEIFRQHTDGDWSHPVYAMMRRLQTIVAGRTAIEPQRGIPLVPHSWGEIVDKLSILKIKCEKLTSPQALANVNRERHALEVLCQSIRTPAIEQLEAELQAVNHRLWNIEDDIRAKEKQQAFDAEFVALARSVYQQNDLRAKLKRQINDILKSVLVEEKSYV